jgi:hypothetical protein
VAGRVGRPGDAVDGAVVTQKLGHWH